MSEIRLINANALKEDLKQYFTAGVLDGVSAKLVFSQILHDIDNATTVPQDCSECKRFEFPYFEIKFDKEQMQELVDKAKAEVLASIEKPNGEWILNYEWATCPFCNTEYRNFEGQIKKFRFCPWCGAELEVTNNE